jgi:MOSC domain-containing protein YiiM
MSETSRIFARVKMTAAGTLVAVHIGTVQLLDGEGRRTAYRKRAVTGPVAVDALGLAGDQQGNRRVHGGREKAVYGYPLSGHDGWRAEFPLLADRFGPGAMGENLVIDGQDETTIHIGDIIRCGTALLQVAQIREPCSTFAAAFGTTRVVRAMVRSGRCGWYYRVLEPGVIEAGARHDVIERLNPGWPISRMAAFARQNAESPAALAELAALPGLTTAWQIKAAKAIALAAARGGSPAIPTRQ